ncbi:MAG: hypothetical protein B7Y87_02595 [Sphingomonadales bacterium 32-64-22]|nr:MAG: hypothetical protein B7Y87_02595 [Sphingomonadales bacterium 32-64-22]
MIFAFFKESAQFHRAMAVPGRAVSIWDAAPQRPRGSCVAEWAESHCCHRREAAISVHLLFICNMYLFQAGLQNCGAA